MRYKLNATTLNRWKTPGKKSDGHRLFWKRNKNGTLTAWQRVSIAGHDIDEKIDTFYKDISKDDLEYIRERGQALKENPLPAETTSNQLSQDITLSEAWEDFYSIMTTNTNSSWSELTARQSKSRILTYISSSPLWGMPVKDIHVADLFAVLSPIRQEKYDTESKVRGVLSKIFTHLISLKVLKDNPAMGVPPLYRNIERKKQNNHLPAELDIIALGGLLNANDTASGSFLVRKALELQAFTCQRSSEIVGAMRSEFDLGNKVWTIPRHRMKVKDRDYDQILTLPNYVVSLIESIPEKSDHLFPANTKLGHINRDSLSKRMRKTLSQHGNHSPHGWRSALKTAATMAADEDDRPLFATSWIECVLDHDEKTKVEAAYNRSRPVQGAGRVLAWWCDQLLSAKKPAA